MKGTGVFLVDSGETIDDSVREFYEMALIRKEDLEQNMKYKGYVMYAFYFALSAPLRGEDYKSCIRWVIKEGGDTDTNAAIAGGILGVLFGSSVFTDNENNMVIMREANFSDDLPADLDIESFIGEEDFNHNKMTDRPQKFTYANFISLFDYIDDCMAYANEKIFNNA